MNLPAENEDACNLVKHALKGKVLYTDDNRPIIKSTALVNKWTKRYPSMRPEPKSSWTLEWRFTLAKHIKREILIQELETIMPKKMSDGGGSFNGWSSFIANGNYWTPTPKPGEKDDSNKYVTAFMGFVGNI